MTARNVRKVIAWTRLHPGPTGSSRLQLAAVIVALLAPVSLTAQTKLQSHGLSNGTGFTFSESVRIGVSVGQPLTGVGRSLEAAGGAGFWYATRKRLVIVGTESETGLDGIPDDFELWQNYPNPFNPTTRIRYGVPKASLVRITVYNILGQVTSELVSEEKAAGYYEVNWSGRDGRGSLAPSGVYFYRIEAGQFVSTRSMVLQK